MLVLFFFFNDTATTEIYTLSLHDALPISCDRLSTIASASRAPRGVVVTTARVKQPAAWAAFSPIGASSTTRQRRGSAPSRSDRKSTRLNSSHANISYAVFCLKKKNIVRYY